MQECLLSYEDVFAAMVRGTLFYSFSLESCSKRALTMCYSNAFHRNQIHVFYTLLDYFTAYLIRKYFPLSQEYYLTICFIKEFTS